MNRVFKVSDQLSISSNNSEIITVFVQGENCTINYDLKDGDYKVLVFVNYDGDCLITENGTITNASVNIHYIELNSYSLIHNNNLLVNKGGNLEITNDVLGVNKKHIKFDIENNESDSEVLITNNVVCLKDSDIKIEVVGTITKGSKRSKCHQKSRCLTFDAPKKAVVLPVLNIDENDVEASHSLSSGTIDEEVLFYMNARGLTKKDALRLMVSSYLMNSDEFYEEYPEGMKIKELAEGMVEGIC